MTDARTLQLEEALQTFTKQVDTISALLGASGEPIAPETAQGVATILGSLCGNARAVLEDPAKA